MTWPLYLAGVGLFELLHDRIVPTYKKFGDHVAALDDLVDVAGREVLPRPACVPTRTVRVFAKIWR